MENFHLANLKRQGFRLTSVRTFIIEFLAAHKKPFDVITIQTELMKSIKKVNKTTIYREIDFLLAQGVVKQINFRDDKNRYEISGLPHHHHLICNTCQKIEDIFVTNELTSIEHKIKKTKKFKIESHSLEFFGLCFQCSSN